MKRCDFDDAGLNSTHTFIPVGSKKIYSLIIKPNIVEKKKNSNREVFIDRGDAEIGRPKGELGKLAFQVERRPSLIQNREGYSVIEGIVMLESIFK